jgi:hypothetical protein
VAQVEFDAVCTITDSGADAPVNRYRRVHRRHGKTWSLWPMLMPHDVEEVQPRPPDILTGPGCEVER